MILLGLRRENHIIKHYHWPHLGVPAPPDNRSPRCLTSSDCHRLDCR
jgi:hypothetical protein